MRDVVIVGENQSQLGALFLLSDAARQMPPADLDQALTAKLKTAAATATATATGSASRVRRAIVLPGEPSLDKGELTEKGSLNQRALRTNYADVIEKLYQSDNCVYVR